jgi:hypothetical protein
MAVESRCICDRCGAVILSDSTALQATCGPRCHSEPVNLCSDCLTTFLAWLGTCDRPTSGS